MLRKRRTTIAGDGIKASQGGRGAYLENVINITNMQYLRDKEAVIQKIPTPITPVSMNGKYITKAFFTEKSTVDYIGSFRGTAICFDAKECHTDTFPLHNVHEHQVAFMQEMADNGAIAFLLIYYDARNLYYCMPIWELQSFIKRMQEGGRKSIAMKELDEQHFLHAHQDGILVPYLTIVKEIYDKEQEVFRKHIDEIIESKQKGGADPRRKRKSGGASRKH